MALFDIPPWNAVGQFPSGAWTTYTPTVSAGTGTFGATVPTGRYIQIGKTVFLQMNVTVTTNGTAAAGVIASLPPGLPAAAGPNAVLSGRSAQTGKMLQGSITSGSPTVAITNYDNTYPISADGQTIFVSGVYETA